MMHSLRQSRFGAQPAEAYGACEPRETCATNCKAQSQVIFFLIFQADATLQLLDPKQAGAQWL